MKLKQLLLENDLDVAVEELKKELATNQWILADPILFRGKKTKGLSFEIKDTRAYRTRRKPRDLSNTLDYILKDFHTVCYPNYPERGKSTFTTPFKTDARLYGQHLYIVLPHRQAKVSYSIDDPYVYFDDDYDNYLEDIVSIFFGQRSMIEDIKTWGKGEYLSNEFIVLLHRLKDIVKYQNSALSIFGCPKEVYRMISEENRKFQLLDVMELTENMPESIQRSFRYAYRSQINAAFRLFQRFFEECLLKYFDNLKLGYPKDAKSAKGEVVIEGEYLLIKYDLWEELKLK